MKKDISLYLLLFSFIITLVISCKSPNDGFSQFQNKELKNISERELLLIEEIAPIHSRGLDAVYKKIVSESKLKGKSYNSFDKSTYISLAVEEFMENDDVIDKISKYETSFIKSTSKTEDLKRVNILFTLFDKFWKECDHENILKSIDTFMGDSEVIILNAQDREVLFLGLSIYYDSFNYWSNYENKTKWNKIKISNRTKGWWGAVCSFAGDVWDAIEPYAVADAKGALAFGIGGAAGGACVGNAPGAAVGAVSGAVSGAIGSSIYEAL